MKKLSLLFILSLTLASCYEKPRGAEFDYGSETGRFAKTKKEYKNCNIFAIPGRYTRMFIVVEKCGLVHYVYFDIDNDDQPITVDVSPCVDMNTHELIYK